MSVKAYIKGSQVAFKVSVTKEPVTLGQFQTSYIKSMMLETYMEALKGAKDLTEMTVNFERLVQQL